MGFRLFLLRHHDYRGNRHLKAKKLHAKSHLMMEHCQVKTFAERVSVEERLHNKISLGRYSHSFTCLQVLYIEIAGKFQGPGTRMPINSYGSIINSDTYREWYTSKLAFWGEKKALICSVCWFLGCKYSHHGRFQTTNGCHYWQNS